MGKPQRTTDQPGPFSGRARAANRRRFRPLEPTNNLIELARDFRSALVIVVMRWRW